MKNNRKFYKLTVGALYTAFNTVEEDGNYNPSEFDETEKAETVKNIGTSENLSNTPIYASGKTFDTVTSMPYIDYAVEVIAFDPDVLSTMRAEKRDGDLILAGGDASRPYFAFGFTEEFSGGHSKYTWNPKCQLVENSDDIATSEETFSEQTDTITIRAYKFDNKNIKVYADSRIKEFAVDFTEEKFFTKPLMSGADLQAVLEAEGA